MIAALAPEQIPGVLHRDEGVFEEHAGDFGEEEVDGGILEMTPAEFRAMGNQIKGLAESRIIVLCFNYLTAQPTKYGVRVFRHQVREAEAHERLGAILESDNDPTWKRAALESMPVEYWAIALRYADDDEQKLAFIAAVFEDLVVPLRTQMTMDRRDLALRVLEAREAYLEEHPDAMVIDEAATGILSDLEERRNAKSLIAQLRNRVRP